MIGPASCWISLNYLTTYPVNKLKIAQQLVFRVDSDARNATVVRAAIRLAHDLGIQCIAEGVETQAQAKFLMSAGCEREQGYFFSRPVEANRATILLQQGRARSARDTLRWWRSRRPEAMPACPGPGRKTVLNQYITFIMPPHFRTIVRMAATKWNPTKYKY